SDQVGNRKLLVESGINISTEVESFVVELEESAKTGILVACDGILIGVLGVADSLKREASVVIEGLKKMGITPVYGRLAFKMLEQRLCLQERLMLFVHSKKMEV
ncbi:serine/threonine protein kinase Ran1, variant 2, partial [Lathyrus oleraceus]